MYKIDQKKMMTPGLQNDFSFYRRSVGKFPSEAPVTETAANQISMWIAEAIPLTSAVSGALKAANKKNGRLCEALGNMANTAAWIVAKDGSLSQKQKDELFTAMVSAIVVFDRATARGAFSKDSGIMMKKCLRTLVAEEHSSESEVVVGAKNSLKYSTVHYGDSSTPGFVDELLE